MYAQKAMGKPIYNSLDCCLKALLLKQLLDILISYF